MKKTHTGCSLKIVFFPLNFVIFLNSASSAAALVFYLPGVCTHTATEGKQSPDYFSKFGKNTIFNEHPVQVWKMWSRVHCGIFRLLDSKKNIKHLMESPLFMQDVHSDDCLGSSFSKMCPQCTEFHFMNHVCREVNNHVYILTFTFKIVTAHSLSSFFLSWIVYIHLHFNT